MAKGEEKSGWVAVGGRATLVGAIVGAVGVNLGRSILTNHFPELWPFFLGGLFVVVVLLFPDGIMGITKKLSEKAANRAVALRKTSPVEGEQA